jgi:quinohemoprotein amine dehydrogenase
MKSARALLFLTVFAGLTVAQDPVGIPIDDQLTIRKCGGCHQRDSKGMMKRISYMRTSPEIWEQAVKRMIRLNGLSITPAEVRDVLRYLSANNGLAPEEMKPGFWEVEHRTNGYQDDYTPSPALQKTCNSCHNIGRVLAQRRTRDDYEKLVSMHVGLFPGSANTFRPPKPKAVSDVNAPARPNANATAGIVMEYPRASAPPAGTKYPVDIALDYLAKEQPLITPEWTAWRAAMRPAKLAGTWLVNGYQPGLGKIYGKVVIAPGTGQDQFTTNVQFTYVNTGATVKTTGKGIVYTGYSWRGRTGTPPASPAITSTAVPSEWREALMLTRDGNKMNGRWFWSGFGELGIDVHLTREGTEPLVIGTDLSALSVASTGKTVKIIGANFPATILPADIDFGRGVTVTKVASSTPSLLTVEVSVAANAPVGLRDVVIGRSSATEAISIYDKIAYIEVSPEASVSRLGGVKYPKEYAQFEAIAWAVGPDGKPQTEDDVYVGAVPARWALEEFTATPTDDDTKFVGTLNDSGFFSPNVEGMNPQRKPQANNHPSNNFGDVWVVASYKVPDGRELKSKAYLVVTVPNYTLYDQPEVVQ